MAVSFAKSGHVAARPRPLILHLARSLSVAVVYAALACALPQDGKHAVVSLEREGQRTSTFKVEIASTPEDRARGLMFRKSIERDQGMLFIFPREEQLAFWMKNTFVPLDMVFVSSDWRVVGVLKDVPPLSEERRMVEAVSQYVLEFAAGTAEREQIQAGMRVIVEGALPAAR